MALCYVAYQTPEAEFVGAAIVEAFGSFKARERAEEAAIHQPGALSVVTRIDAAPPDLIGWRTVAARRGAAGPRRQETAGCLAAAPARAAAGLSMGAPRDIYDGEPWSEMDLEDLKGAVAYGHFSRHVYSAISPLKRNRKNLFTGLVPYDQ
jgi:hypothetical protein